MNRDQKATAIAEIADQIRESEAIFAVDYRGISVPRRPSYAAGCATRTRPSGSSRTRSASARRTTPASTALKALLGRPRWRSCAATSPWPRRCSPISRRTGSCSSSRAAYGRGALDPEQLKAIAKLPSRQVLYGQLVGLIASPITGLARSLNGLTSGLAVALGGVLEKKQSGEIPAGDAPGPEDGDRAPSRRPPEAEAAQREQTRGGDETARRSRPSRKTQRQSRLTLRGRP